MIKKFLAGFQLLAVAFLSVMIVGVSLAEARSSFGGFRGSSFRSSSFSRSYSRPSYSYSRPSTSYSRPSSSYSRPSTTYNSYSSTTVNRSGGGGFMSSMFGSIAGYGIASWLFSEDKPAAQAPAPVAPAPAPACVPTTDQPCPVSPAPVAPAVEAPKAQ